MSVSVATVSSKGQLVIPAEIREALNIRSGTRMAMLREGNRIIMQPVNEQYVSEMRGMTAGGPSMTDDLLRERREEEAKYGW